MLLSSPCFSDVCLTDEEAEEMLLEMEKSEQELDELRSEASGLRQDLASSEKRLEMSEKRLAELEKEPAALRSELNALLAASDEQKRYYEERLSEAGKKRTLPWILTAVSALINIILSVALIVAL